MRHILLIALALLVVSSLAIAQDNVLDLRVVEVNEEGDVTYNNFIYARNFGPWMVEVFHARMPDYNETSFGVGYNFATLGDWAVYGTGHYTAAIDDNYVLPGVFAIDVDGAWTGSFWAVYYVPLSDAGITQILIDPLEVQYGITESISVGLSSYLWQPDGGDWFTKVGPKVSVLDKWGATEVRATTNTDGGMEFQLRRLFFF